MRDATSEETCLTSCEIPGSSGLSTKTYTLLSCHKVVSLTVAQKIFLREKINPSEAHPSCFYDVFPVFTRIYLWNEHELSSSCFIGVSVLLASRSFSLASMLANVDSLSIVCQLKI